MNSYPARILGVKLGNSAFLMRAVSRVRRRTTNKTHAAESKFSTDLICLWRDMGHSIKENFPIFFESTLRKFYPELHLWELGGKDNKSRITISCMWMYCESSICTHVEWNSVKNLLSLRVYIYSILIIYVNFNQAQQRCVLSSKRLFNKFFINTLLVFRNRYAVFLQTDVLCILV